MNLERIFVNQEAHFQSGRRRNGVWGVLAVLALSGSLSVGLLFAHAQAKEVVPVVTGNNHVDKLLSEMTLDEKISMLHGAQEPASTYQGQAGFLPGIPRLGISSVRFSDGPPGILTRVPAMAPTATMGLAATFSTADALQNGQVIAREAKSHGIDVALEPFINIDRDVSFRRGYNTFGEDPLLTGEIGAAEIRGIQSLGIMSQAKHYIAFDSNGSSFLSTYNVDVEQQAMHEIYLPPFVDAIDAGVSSIMCSYNEVNGKFACGNSDTLVNVLRDELHFKGFVTSDWGATHAVTFINDGLDMEMPGTVETGRPREAYFTQLKSAVQSGKVSEVTINRATGRILLEMDRFGLLTGRVARQITPPLVAENAPVIEKTSEDAAVLLKNNDSALPLKKSDLQSLALIGPGAGQTIAIGQPGEKAVGLPERAVGTDAALRKDTAGMRGVHIAYAVADDRTGSPVPAQYLSHDGLPGLERTSADGSTQSDAQVDFTLLNGKAIPTDSHVTWEGALTIPSSGAYVLHMQIMGAFGNLTLDGKTIAHNGKMFVHGDITQAGESDVLPTTDGPDNLKVDVNLGAGPHKLSLTVSPDTSRHPIQIRLSWLTPEQKRANYKAAIDAAREAKTAVVFVWAQGDPKFQLSDDQNKLVEDIAAVNPNTIIVLNLCQPVALPWLNKVKAVLQMWWPGDEGGWATANVLLGKISPAGRLPFSWGQSLADYPATDPAHPERGGNNVSGTGVFSEGIYVGYRWFDKQGIQSLFPFGFGLSYTRFNYSQLKVALSGDGGLDVRFAVKNIGAFASDEVPQIYVGAPSQQPKGVQFAVRSLAAFDRIHLDPGQTRMVKLHVPPRSLQYWSTGSGGWVTGVGSRTVYVGPSSADLPLSAAIVIR
jgi:beta-glucosidase